jgi:FkbM family methyltransferase
MTYLSFTRNFEDVMINRVFNTIQNGFYIDVGAYQPISDSNTCALYQRGWRGVVVEPQSRLHPQWAKHRPEDILIGAAIGKEMGEVTFYQFPWNDQAATIAPEIVAMHEREGRQVQSQTVQQVTLTHLLEQHRSQGEIHLLSIDVEGAERLALEGLDRTRFRPWMIVLESVLPNRPQPNFSDWEHLLLDTDYEFVYFDAVNRFYLAKEHLDLKVHFNHPPCVWDNFADYRLVHAQQVAAKAQADLEQLKAAVRALVQ